MTHNDKRLAALRLQEMDEDNPAMGSAPAIGATGIAKAREVSANAAASFALTLPDGSAWRYNDGDKVKGKEFDLGCFCELTEDEFAERSDALAQANIKLAEIEAEKKRIIAKLKADAAPFIEAVEYLAPIVHERKEERPVKCAYFYNKGAGEKYLVRLDTLTLERVVPLDVDDRQMELF